MKGALRQNVADRRLSAEQRTPLPRVCQPKTFGPLLLVDHRARYGPFYQQTSPDCLFNTAVGQVQGKLVEQKYPNLLTEECKVVKPDKVLKYGTAGERCWGIFQDIEEVCCHYQ